jgi:hypothetical protein
MILLLPRVKPPMGILEVLDLEADVGVQAREVLMSEEVFHVRRVGAIPNPELLT